MDLQTKTDQPMRLDEAPLKETINTLQDMLCQAIAEIKTLQAENGCLRQEVDELRQGQEELKRTKDLLKKETKKSVRRTYAYIDSLSENAKLVNDLKTKETEWKQRLEGAEEATKMMLEEKDNMWQTEVQELHRENKLSLESWLKKEEQWKLQEKYTEEKIKILSQQVLSLQIFTTKPQNKNQNQRIREAPMELGEEEKKKKVEMWWRDGNEKKPACKPVFSTFPFSTAQ
ncbi:uncharacterized protein LOC107989257 [Cynoglossus semilaevis]|uniref:uncharacterized protein LOC107989257 n=1 Tax=Cynoglossus semilaevis TaxID=244447 RepID=UPI0007DC8F15|nr:uncharacterized protein LOC107989257 [Cynoglossus semilaevis]